MSLINLDGKVFGDWSVVSRAANRGRAIVWNCACICGTERPVLSNSLLRTKSTGCGCRQHANTSARLRTHGHAPVRKETATYRCWKHIIQRCFNSNCKDFRYYGGRGIRVCERWLKFENFLADMGTKPAGLTIERQNNDGNYEPGNCRWATMAEQNQNKRGPYASKPSRAQATMQEGAS